MKSKIFSIILIVLGIGLITVGIFTNNRQPELKNAPKGINGYTVKEKNVIKTCYDPECQSEKTDLYADISYKYDSKVLQNAIKILNKNTTNFYKVASESTMEDPNCSPEIRAVNKNSIRFSNDYNTYSDGKVITLNIKRTKTNICTREVESMQSENYVYDIENDKMLNIEETMQKLQISKEELNNAIKKSNETLSRITGKQIATKDNYTDIKIYYNTKGQLYVSYYVDETKEYISALIREKVN